MFRYIYDRLSDQMKGRISYYRYYRAYFNENAPFNGQSKRLEQFNAILHYLKPKGILETGTDFGSTTVCFAKTGLPTYAFELVARSYGFAAERLRGNRNVKIIYSDSRVGLKQALSKPLAKMLDQPLFFYLDAHWFEDLPLAEELDVILERCSQPIIMIDDFRVVGDDGYGYDDYGPGRVLDASYVARHVERYELSVLYPAAPSDSETGNRRGSVVLCNSEHAEVLCKTGLFKMG